MLSLTCDFSHMSKGISLDFLKDDVTNWPATTVAPGSESSVPAAVVIVHAPASSEVRLGGLGLSSHQGRIQESGGAVTTRYADAPGCPERIGRGAGRAYQLETTLPSTGPFHLGEAQLDRTHPRFISVFQRRSRSQVNQSQLTMQSESVII